MAGLTVQNIRDYVRSFVDVDEVDIPDTLVDSWHQEAYDDLLGADVRWPFYEVGGVTTTDDSSVPYSITTVVGQQHYDLPAASGVNGLAAAMMPKRIIAVQGPHWELLYHSQYALESTFVPAFIVSQEPERWSEWGEKGITLWPIPNAAYSINIRGYRMPEDYISAGAGSMIDAPNDFHTVIQQYVLSNAWAQQTDLQQASYWMQNYEGARDRLKKKYLRAPLPENLALNRGKVTRDLPPRLRFPFEGINSIGLSE